MADYTEKLNLKKPSQSDFYNIDDLNENFQKIDDFANEKDNEISPITKGGTGATTASSAANNLMVKSIGGGTEIKEGDDLDSYKTVGNYICPLTVTAQKIVNCPIASAFKMTVGYANGNGNYLYQEITHFQTGVKHYRSYSASEKKWDNWNVTYGTANKPTPADIGAARIKTGTYVGTGTYGVNNPNSITFDFEPKLVILQHESATVTLIRGSSEVRYYKTSSTGLVLKLSWSGKVLSWYNVDSATGQFNSSVVTYHWAAIG